MVGQFCTRKLDELTQLVHLHENFMLTLCILNLVFSIVAILGNLLIIRALWKSSSIPATVKRLFLSLAFSDLAVGMLPQLMLGVIIADMLKTASIGNDSFASFCPTILNVFYFFFFLLCCVSFLSITAIAVDRLLAVLLHLRYHELVTLKRVIITLVSLWLTSVVAASIFIILPASNGTVVAIIQFIGLLLSTVAYTRVYKVAIYHRNQIQSQLQLQNPQAVELLQQKKSALNSLFVYIVFLVCYLPLFFYVIFLLTGIARISWLFFHYASVFLIFLNSSLNPLIYCWRYREIREIVKRTLRNIFYLNGDGS